jgi:hypothetical protein
MSGGWERFRVKAVVPPSIVTPVIDGASIISALKRKPRVSWGVRLAVRFERFSRFLSESFILFG